MRITINNFSNSQITGIDLKMRKRIGYFKNKPMRFFDL